MGSRPVEMDPIGEQWLAVEELAVPLRVSKATVYRLIKDEGIPAIRVGRQYRIAASDAAVYLNVPDIPSSSMPDSNHPQADVERTPEESDSAKEKLLSISEVAKRFGVPVRTVGYWETKGRLKASSRTSGGHRRWREADVINVLNDAEAWVTGYRHKHDVNTDDIVRMRDVEGMTWTAIADKLGMTRWGIRCRYDRNKRNATTSAADATHEQPVSMSPDQPVNGVSPEAAWHVLLPGVGQIVSQT
jgi:excisionase family DNA binding protein